MHTCPQPLGHMSCSLNHALMCSRCPPWPHTWHHVDGPLTAVWQIEQMLRRIICGFCSVTFSVKNSENGFPYSMNGEDKLALHAFMASAIFTGSFIRCSNSVEEKKSVISA